VLADNVNLFNGASRNAIALGSDQIKGHYEQSTFIPWTSGLTNHRDITDTSTSVSSVKLTDQELVTVKTNRRLGPVDTTLDVWKKMGKNWQTVSLVFGRQTAVAKMEEMVDTILSILVNAISGVGSSDLVYDGTSGTFVPSTFVQGMKKLGDKGSRIAAWVMHSKVFYDLVGNAVTSDLTGLANVVVYGGGPGTLGKPVVVIDSDSLITDGSPDTYHTLGLVPGAARITESETQDVVAETITGKPNLIGRVQGEYAYNIGLKGMAWDIASGGSNPTVSTLTTAAYWDKVVTSNKDLPGVVMNTQ